MKERLKKASLTVASACLVAGGLVSVGWAGYSASENQSKRIKSISSPSAENTEKQQAMPDELEINGEKYKKIGFEPCDPWPACSCRTNPLGRHCNRS